MTILTTALFVGVSASPVVGAHWDGSTAPHEHEVFAGSSVGVTWYGGQRLCVDTSTSLPSVIYSDDRGNCPPGHIPVPPFSGITRGLGNCFDADGQEFVDMTLKASADVDTTLDFGTPANFVEPFADHFRHGTLGLPGAGGAASNPTGITPLTDSTTNPYPTIVNNGPTGIQLTINKLGLGALGIDTATQLVPGPDVGDNDFEVGQGIACHTYAIDSGDTSTDGSGASTGNGGASLNDPICIGGDNHFNVAHQSGLFGCATDSPWIDRTGRTSMDPFPETGAGFLVSPDASSPFATPVGYSVCNDLGGAGCTNIPNIATGGVYSSLQDCVYIDEAAYALPPAVPYQSPAQTHAGTSSVYRGEQAAWGTPTPQGSFNGGTHRSCFPERLAWSGNNVYLPESLVKDQGDPNAAWNPDYLPATYESIESVTVFFDLARTNTWSGTMLCPTGSHPTTCLPDLNPNSPTPTAHTPIARSAVFAPWRGPCAGDVTISRAPPLPAYTRPLTTIRLTWTVGGCEFALPTLTISTTPAVGPPPTVSAAAYGTAGPLTSTVTYTVAATVPSAGLVSWRLDPGSGIYVGNPKGLYTYTPTPTNEQLPSVNPTVDAWLSTGYREKEATSQITGAAIEGLTADPFGFINDAANQTIQALPAPLQDAWATLDSGAEGALTCATTLVEDPSLTTNTVPVASQAANCVVGVVQDVGAAIIDAIQNTDLETIQSLPATTIESIQETDVTRLPFAGPLLGSITTSPLLPDSNDLGPMPNPNAPWSPDGVAGTPLQGVLWGDTPYPRFLASTTSALMMEPVFDTISNAQSLTGAQLIGTIDSGFYNILVIDEDSGQTLVAQNWPIGTTRFIDFNDINNNDTQDAEISVQASLATKQDGTQAPVLVVQNLAGEPLRIVVAAFLQVPNTPYVIALGQDGTTNGNGGAGIPDQLELSLGANVIEQTLGATPTYSFHAATPTAWPLRLVASVFEVDEQDRLKTPILGERADLSVLMQPAPTTVDATFTRDATDGMSLQWAATSTTTLTLGAHFEHAGASDDIALAAEDLPTRLVAQYRRSPSVDFSYTASAKVSELEASWMGSTPHSESAGGFQASEIPRSVRLRHDPLTDVFEYASDEAIPRITLGSFVDHDDNPGAAQCSTSDEADYFSSISVGKSSCTMASIGGVRSIHARYSDPITIATQRDTDGGPLVIAIDGPTKFYLSTTSWPKTVSAQLIRSDTAVQLVSTMSSPVDELTFDIVDGNARINAIILGLPAQLRATADFPTGSIRVDATTSTPIEDFNFQYRKGSASASLGDDDGVILRGDGEQIYAAVVRLRDFGSAQVAADADSGLQMRTDTTSASPFHVRYTSAENWLSADLPRLPASVTATYNSTGGTMDFQYHASEAITDLNGHFKIAGTHTTALIDIDDFPTSLTVRTNFGAGTIQVNADAPIGRVEVALAGSDRMIRNLASDNYIEFDQLHPVEVGGKTVPTFHVKLRELQHLNATFAAGQLHLQSRFATSPGTLGIAYEGPQGWLYANVLTSLPPDLQLSLSRTNLAWASTPSTTTSITGHASLDGFHGRWDLQGLPDKLNANWTISKSAFIATLDHSAASLPGFFVDALVNLSNNATNARVRVDMHAIPARVSVEANGGTGKFEVTLKDAQGQPATAGLLSAAYISNATQGLPQVPGGGIAYARLAKGLPSEVYVSLPGVSRMALSTQPDIQQAGARWLNYSGTGGVPFTLDVADDVGTSLRSTISTTPQHLLVKLTLDNATGASVLDLTSSSTSTWSADWIASDTHLHIQSNIPTSLHADNLGGTARFASTPPLSGELSIAPVGASVVPAFAGDYVVARPAQSKLGMLALRATGLASLDAQPALGSYTFQRLSSAPIWLDIVLSADSLVGRIDGLPQDTSLQLGAPGTTRATWTASAPTSLIDAMGVFKGNSWRIHAERIPSGFAASFDPSTGRAVVESTTSEPFGTLELYYSPSGPFVPELDGQGFVVDYLQGGKKDPRIAVRLDALLSLDVRSIPTFEAELRRAIGGGTFTGDYQAEASLASFTLASLPQELDVTIGTASAGGVSLHAHTSGEPLGNAAFRYLGSGATSVDLDVTGAPDTLDVTLAQAPSGFELTATQSGASTRLVGSLLTSDGYAGNFDLTQIPPFVHAKSDKLTGILLSTVGGGLTGSLYVGRVGAPAYQPPLHVADALGASLVTEPGKEHVWARVEGLTSMYYTKTQAGNDLVHVAQAATTRPFFVHYENATLGGTLSIHGMPDNVWASTRVVDSMLSLSLQASANAQSAAFEGYTKSGAALHIGATMSPVPSQASIVVATDPNGNIAANFATSTPSTITLDATGSDGAYATGTLVNMPTSGSFLFDPHAPLGSCSFSTNLGGPIGSATFKMGRGDRSTAQWSGPREQWANIDLRDPEAPHLDIHVLGFRSLMACAHEEDAFQLIANVGAAQHLHASFLDATKSIKLDLEGVSGGTYSYYQKNGKIIYEGSGVQRVQGDVTALLKDVFMGHDAQSLVFIATGVPGRFEVTTSNDGALVLDSGGARLGSLEFNMLLNPAPRGGDDGPTVEEPPFILDARLFEAGPTILRISEGAVRFPGNERNKFLFKNDGHVYFGLDAAEIVGGTLTLTGSPFNIEADRWGIGPDHPLRGKVEIGDGTSPPNIVNFYVSSMPPLLSFNFANPIWTSLSSIEKFLEFSLAPSGPIPEFALSIGPDSTHGWSVRLYDVGTVTVHSLAGAAFSLGLVGSIGGGSVGYYWDEAHYWLYRVGLTTVLNLEGDLDGDTRYESVPHFIDFGQTDTTLATIEVRSGDWGIRFGAEALSVGGAVLLETIVAGVNGAEFARTGAIAVTNAFLENAQNGIIYLADASLWED